MAIKNHVYKNEDTGEFYFLLTPYTKAIIEMALLSDARIWAQKAADAIRFDDNNVAKILNTASNDNMDLYNQLRNI